GRGDDPADPVVHAGGADLPDHQPDHRRRRRVCGAPARPRPRQGDRMSFDLGILVPYTKQLISGFRMTLFLWVVGGLLAMAIGFAIALLQMVGGRVVGAVIRAYIELMRGTPLLAQLFLLYFGGPAIGITLDAMTVGLLILGLYVGAYFVETFRAGFES